MVLPRPDNLTLPIIGDEFKRAEKALLTEMQRISSATASAKLHQMGVRYTFMQGILPRQADMKIVGSAVTLQFMPQREDIVSGLAQEYVEKDSALWHVMDIIAPDDVLVVQAFGDPYTGVLGEMLIGHFRNRGGVGIVVDGYIRDWPRVKHLDVPIWSRGTTPNYASQSHLFPWAYSVPIACSGVLVLPGDIVIADDDGAVLVPVKVAPLLLESAGSHEDWEVFSRMQISQGGELRKYYPLNAEAQREYEIWKQQQMHQAK
jgi:regulator of RNase E activity RraA